MGALFYFFFLTLQIETEKFLRLIKKEKEKQYIKCDTDGIIKLPHTMK